MPLMSSCGMGAALALAGLWAGSKLITCSCRRGGKGKRGQGTTNRAGHRCMSCARNERKRTSVWRAMSVCTLNTQPCLFDQRPAHAWAVAGLPDRSRLGDTRCTAARLALPTLRAPPASLHAATLRRCDLFAIQPASLDGGTESAHKLEQAMWVNQFCSSRLYAPWGR